jgi:hypothetical protein
LLDLVLLKVLVLGVVPGGSNWQNYAANLCYFSIFTMITMFYH